MTDARAYTLPAASGLLGLLFAPAVDCRVEQFDAWVRVTVGRAERRPAKKRSPLTRDSSLRSE